MPENDRKNRLEKARAGVRKAKKIGKNVANVGSLLGYLEVTDIFFVFAFTGAAIKDIFDLTPLGFPGIEHVLTMIASTLIAFTILITGASAGKKGLSGTAKKWIVLLAGTIIESIFGLSFLPMETIDLIVILIITLQARKNAAQAAQSETIRGSEVYA